MPERPMIRPPVFQPPRISSLPGVPPQTSQGTGTCLAFDFGLRRIGVAVGDAALHTAHPLKPIRAGTPEAAAAAIAPLVAEWQPARLIVGIPTDAEGKPKDSAAGRGAERFAKLLEARFKLHVERVDERYSSTEAEGRIREAAGARRAAKASRERTLDSHAALVILEQYFSERAR